MTVNLQYRLNNKDSFIEELMSYVETVSDVDYNIFTRSETNNKKDYFGKFEWDSFTIFDQPRFLFQKRIILKIYGQLNSNILDIRIKFYYYWMAIINAFLMAIISVVLVINLNFYIGLCILIITSLQSLFVLRNYVKRKEKFRILVESMVHKN